MARSYVCALGFVALFVLLVFFVVGPEGLAIEPSEPLHAPPKRLLPKYDDLLGASADDILGASAEGIPTLLNIYLDFLPLKLLHLERKGLEN